MQNENDIFIKRYLGSDIFYSSEIVNEDTSILKNKFKESIDGKSN